MSKCANAHIYACVYIAGIVDLVCLLKNLTSPPCRGISERRTLLSENKEGVDYCE